MSWLTDEEFTAVVETAVRAPSMHNSQPWRFRLAPDHIDLRAEPTGGLPVADATGWASRIGCGAALFNLRLAVAVHGTPASVRLQPDPDDPDLIARLTPDAPRPPTALELRLHRAIPHRHSNRSPFLDKPVPLDARAHLVAAARAEGAWLDLLAGPIPVELAAEMVRAADRALRADEEYQRELAAWTRPELAAPDGVPHAAGGPAPQPDALLARREFGGAVSTSVRDFERDPLIGVIGAAGDWPADQTQAGQALQRVLLTATDLGLAASLFSQPIEVPRVREQLRAALGRHKTPQMLMRFGYAPDVPSSRRRPAGDVIVSS